MMGRGDIIPLLYALLPTIVIEYAVLLLLGEKRKRVLWSSVVVNVLTNVPLNLYLLTVSDGLTDLIVGEVLVVVVETLWYLYFVKRWRQVFVYSLLCNMISFLTGVLFQLWLFWLGIKIF